MPDGHGERFAALASPTIVPIGDAAILITLDPPVDPARSAWAQAVAAALESARRGTPALGRPVPALASVLVPFDPLGIDLADATDVARAAATAVGAVWPAAVGPAASDPDGRPPIEIPVRYGGPDGPDLDEVAALHGVRPADVIELHASARYHVLFIGFAPGFGYLGGLPAALATPRRASPRERVPAGSVGIAGEQTAVYPLAMPGGWQLIGRTEAVLFDPTHTDPALLRPGAEVRFVPVTSR